MRQARHTIRVNDKNLERLKRFKKEWGLTYNDIVSMALEALRGVTEEREMEIYDNICRIKVNVDKFRINYKEVCKLIEKGYDIFIPNITGRQASIVKSKIQKRMEKKARYLKAEGTEDREKGYLFLVKAE